MTERQYAVAVRDEQELFLWIRIRRTCLGDIYYVFPTGRREPEWKKWDPHGSHHKSGQRHHKSFGQKLWIEQRQKPNSAFVGSETLITRPIASHEPRAFGVICNQSEFSEVLEISTSLLSSQKYETTVSIDLTESGRPPVFTALGEFVVQRAFSDATPWIWVSVVNNPLAPELAGKFTKQLRPW